MNSYAVSIIKKAGFNNISIDLIYGLPTQTFEGFVKDIEQAIELEKKMEKADPSVQFVKTEWGSGYSFSYPPIRNTMRAE